MLTVNHLTGKGKKFHLNDITFAAENGYIYMIAGENGAGKTTLFQALMGTADYTGEILWNGRDIRTCRKEYLNRTAFISDDVELFMAYDAQQNVALYRGFYDVWENAVFADRAKQFQIPLHTPLHKLSRGEYIKFQIAFGLAHHTENFYFDEATAGMDAVFRKDFFRLLRQLLIEEKLVLMSSHIRTELEELADYTAIMTQGTLSSFTENGV